MRIAKPILLVSTPVGVIGGLYEAWRLAGGLVVLMLALVGFMCVAAASVVATIRREKAEEARLHEASLAAPPGDRAKRPAITNT